MRSAVSVPVVAIAQNVMPVNAPTSYGTFGPVYVPPSAARGWFEVGADAGAPDACSPSTSRAARSAPVAPDGCRRRRRLGSHGAGIAGATCGPDGGIWTQVASVPFGLSSLYVYQ